MTYTPTSIFGARLVGKLTPWLTDDLSRYADAIAVMFDPILELAEEEGTDGEPGYVPTWGKLLDPSARPYPNDPAKEIARLVFLGQFVGATIPVGASESEARALVKAESGLERGTRASVESAIERSLNTVANQVLNPSFEYDTPGAAPVGWVNGGNEGKTNSVFEVVSTWAVSGERSLLIQSPLLADARETTAVTGPWPVTPGESWFALGTVNVLSTVGDPHCYVEVLFYNGSSFVGAGTTAEANTPGIYGLDGVFTVPVGADRMYLQITTIGATSKEESSIRVEVDAVMAAPGTTVGTYSDGDTPGYVWRGTKGDSVTGEIGSTEYDLIERTEPSGVENAYWFLVVVRPEQLVPEGNPAALEANIRSVKPAGLLFEVIETDEGPLWDEATKAWDEVGEGVTWENVTKGQV